MGRLDTRITGPLTPPRDDGRPPAADDPALGLGGRNVIESPALGCYLVAEAEAPGKEPYVSLSLDLNFARDWRAALPARTFYRNPTVYLCRLMRRRTALRILLLGCYFDLAAPLSAALSALRHNGVPADRVHVRALEGGHSLSDYQR